MPAAHDTEGLDRERNQIAQHDAVIISSANEIDQLMISLGTWLDDHDLSNTSRHYWTTRPSKNPGEIRKRFPADWIDGAFLIERTRTIFDYRGRVAHGTVVLNVRGPDGMFLWERRSVAGDHVIEIAELPDWEMKFHVVQWCWKFLCYPAIPMAMQGGYGLDAFRLKEYLIDSEQEDWLRGEPEEFNRWKTAVNWMFPPSKFPLT